MKTSKQIAKWVLKERDSGIDFEIIENYLKVAYPAFYNEYLKEVESMLVKHVLLYMQTKETDYSKKIELEII